MVSCSLSVFSYPTGLTYYFDGDHGFVNQVDNVSASYDSAQMYLTVNNGTIGNSSYYASHTSTGVSIPKIAGADNISGCMIFSPNGTYGNIYDLFASNQGGSYASHFHYVSGQAGYYMNAMLQGWSSWAGVPDASYPYNLGESRFYCWQFGRGINTSVWVNGVMVGTGVSGTWYSSALTCASSRACSLFASDANAIEAMHGIADEAYIWVNSSGLDNAIVTQMYSNIQNGHPAIYTLNVSYGFNSTVDYIDSFGSGSNCVNDSFSCGNLSDNILNVGGEVIINITQDDNSFNYTCLLETVGSSVYIRSCLMRYGLNDSYCDGSLRVTNTFWNTSFFYNCPVGSMVGCGWNGLNGIPKFSSASFGLDTGVENRSVFSVANYVCDNNNSGTVFLGLLHNISVSDRKGSFCVGDGFSGGVYVLNSFVLFSDIKTCSLGSFCDSSILNNYSISSLINGSFCVGGCNDLVKDGSETDVDYGGFVCGNCSPLGKSSDTYYNFARELQGSNVSGFYFSPVTPFNSSFCSLGSDVGNSTIMQLLFLLLISGISFIFIIVIILLISIPIGLKIVKYIKDKRR